MKKLLLLTVLASALPMAMQAQDDDLYFSPKKVAQESSVEDHTPAYYVGSNRSVDEYNRRGMFRSKYQPIGSDSLGTVYGILPDTTYIDTTLYNKGRMQWDDDDYAYTRRMSRWDGFYDPWFYSYWGPGRYGWYGPRYGYGPWYAGWYDPWYNPWYDPWYYGYGYGYGWGWYGAYSPWYYGYGWGYPYYYGWYGGGYVRNYAWGNPSGLAGNRTWSYSRPGTSSGNGFGRTFGSGGNTSRTNGYTSRSNTNRSFGSRTRTYTPSSTNNSGFGSTRSTSSSPSSGSFGSGGFGGGHSSGGGFGGGRSGGGSFGGGRR